MALLELGTVLLAFGGMAVFFAWTAHRERRRVVGAQELVGDSPDYDVLVVDLDVVPSSGSPAHRIARIVRAA